MYKKCLCRTKFFVVLHNISLFYKTEKYGARNYSQRIFVFFFCLFHSGCKLNFFSKILVSNKFQSFSFKKKTFFKSNIVSELTKACRLMTRVEPLLVGIKFFEAVNTSEGLSGICDLGLLLKVVESLLDVYYCTG